MPPHHTLLWNKRSLNYLACLCNLEIVDYFEEELSPTHRHWAFSTVIDKFLIKLIGINKKTIDGTLIRKVTYKLSSFIALFLKIIRPNFIQTGHSSIIIFKKSGMKII
jgi:hypothetical protein